MTFRLIFQAIADCKCHMHSNLRDSFLSASIFVLLTFIASTSGVFAKPLSVVLVPLGSHENEFWGRVIDFTEAVAEDLNINLEVAFTERAATSGVHIRRLVYGILDRSVKPDYILIPYWVGAGDIEFIRACELKGIKVFLFNARILTNDLIEVGAPREKFKNWIGYMYPDDKKAGHDLANTLLKQAMLSKPNIESRYEFAALKAPANDNISDIRFSGLSQFISETKQILGVSFNTTWRRNSALGVTEKIMNEQPKTSIIWTVGDEIALGAIDYLKSINIKPGKDILIGGFNLSKSGLDAVKSGEMTALMGGHFMEGGWSLLLIYDYHHNHDFINDPGLTHVTPLHTITAENVDEFLELTSENNFRKIDFKQYSKTVNPDIKKYDFSLETLYKKFKESK